MGSQRNLDKESDSFKQTVPIAIRDSRVIERERAKVPRVFIPPLLRPLAGGLEQVDMEGTSVRELIDGLEAQFPGIRARLCQDDELKPGLTVAVDGNVSHRGLYEKVQQASEVHFLPAVGGG